MKIQTDKNQSVLRLTLNDNASRNSLSEDMIRALLNVLEEAGRDPSVSVIIIAANGSAFCSGHDLKQLSARRTDEDQGLAHFEMIFDLCSKLMMAVQNHRCPIIAEVDGLASAAGCQLVASCDLAYASPTSSFCTPGVNIGLFCSTPMVALSRNVASKHAMEMLLTGDVKDADFAAHIGLVNAVVPQEKLSDHVDTVAASIATKSQTAILYGKRAFYEQRALPLDQAYALTAGIMAKNMMDGSACEGLNAFIEKRTAVWPRG